MPKKKRISFQDRLNSLFTELTLKIVRVAFLAIVGFVANDVARHLSENHLSSGAVAAVSTGLAALYNPNKKGA